MCPRLRAVLGCPAPAAAVISREILSSSMAWAWTAASKDIQRSFLAGDERRDYKPPAAGQTPTEGGTARGGCPERTWARGASKHPDARAAWPAPRAPSYSRRGTLAGLGSPALYGPTERE